MRKLIGIGTFILALSSAVQAQNFEDFALRFSQTSPGGSSRIRGLAGSSVSLGGDISAAHINPAGLGWLNKSEITLTPLVNFINTNSLYLDNPTDDYLVNFNIAQAGVAFRGKGKENEGFKGGTFAFSVNRIADFNQDVFYSGSNTVEDLADYVVDDLNSAGFSAISEAAFETFLVDEFFFVNSPGDTSFFFDRNFYAVDENGNYITDNDGNLIPGFPDEDNPVQQSETIESRGAHYQFDLSYGANFNDRFYLGAALGISRIRNTIDRFYSEFPTNTDLDNFEIRDRREITGVGVNGTFGLIARPVDLVSLGISYRTPTKIFLSDNGDLRMITNFIDQTFEYDLTFTELEYSVKTPGKISGGATVFLGKSGFITGDIDYVQYSKIRLDSDDDFSFDSENQFFEENFKDVINWRFGAEFRYEFLRLRAGYGQQGDPTADIDDIDRGLRTFSIGAGIRFEKFFLDIAMENIKTNEAIRPYPTAELATTEREATGVSLTLGVRFK